MTQKQQDNNRTLEEYCQVFSQINVYKNRKKGGIALNQPILLLSVIDAISQGIVTENHITISDELIDIFKKYWSLLGNESFKSSDFALPFFHLKNGVLKFWHLKYSSEYEGGRPQSIPRLRRDVNYAALDSELFSFIQATDTRKELIDAIISAWFSASQKELEDLLKINEDFQNRSTENDEKFKKINDQEQKPKFYMRKSAVRDAFFRKAIVQLYGCRCAFCRLKVTYSLNQSIVDGAHIKPFSEFYDSRLSNGISLCKNHHWAFDTGLFSIDDDYKIIVSNKFKEDSPNSKTINDFHGEKLLLPNVEKYVPRLEAFRWHRENRFRQ